MRLFGRALALIVGAVALLAAVLLLRTWTAPPPPGTDLGGVRVGPPIAVDIAGAAARLSQAVQIPTVRHQDPAQDDDAQWTRLHALIEADYPLAHAAMRRDETDRRTLIYTWPGADPALAPVVLMAHQDVVPVTPGTEAAWRHPPFSGAIAEGAVWGRGSIDDKGSLFALFEAAEALAKAGFKPRRTVIFVSGGDEETSGLGARAVASRLAAQGVKAEFVLDEGLVVVADNPITHGPLALIGTAEKGFGTIRLTARSAGGHSSAPPADGGAVAELSRAVAAVVARPFPLAFRGPGAEMVQAAAPGAGFGVRLAVANRWLLGPLLVKQVAATPAGAALLHTTIAPTILQAGAKENVLPQEASAWINYRIAPGDTAAQVMRRAREAVGPGPVTVAWTGPPREASPVSSTASWGWKVTAATARAVTGAPTSPGLVTAATDSRSLAPVARDVYRFQAISLRLRDVEMIHGTDEHLTLANLERLIQFYGRLIETAAG